MFSAIERCGGEAQLLLHDGDAGRRASLRRQAAIGAAIDQDLPAVGPQRARQQVDQRDLPAPFSPSRAWMRPGDERDRDLAQTGLPKNAFETLRAPRIV